MIIVLYPSDAAGRSQDMVHILQRELAGVPVEARSWEAPGAWPGGASADDLLILPFCGSDLPAIAQEFIGSYRTSRRIRAPDGSDLPGIVLPVALGECDRPPEPVGGVKSMPLLSMSLAPLLQRVRLILGLAWSRRDTCVFVSYKSSDGADIAEQVFQDLRALGIHVWKDTAQDQLQGSDEVQVRIDNQLDQSSLVVLLDTPEAPTSKWMHHEVDRANGLLLPILPVVVGRARGTRFGALKSLQRDVLLEHALNSLTQQDLARIREALEVLVLDVASRRRATHFRASEAFKRHQFDWRAVDAKRLMYRAERRCRRLPLQVILTHVSGFEADHAPSAKALRAFVHHPQPNYRLLVYESSEGMLPDPELQRLYNQAEFEGVVIAHHSQIDLLIESNFSSMEAL